jgi:nondiscriminating aspartyl-tRNA synthetase
MSQFENPHVRHQYQLGAADISVMVQTVRDHKRFAFLVVRGDCGELQVVVDKSKLEIPPVGSFVRLQGNIISSDKAHAGMEMQCNSITVSGTPTAVPPFPLDKPIEASLDLVLDLRAISLRNVHSGAVFRCQSAIGNAFRDQLHQEGFIEIHSPKLVGGGTEGGSDVFKVAYFDREASLAQSPQLYKQIACGAFGKVYEVGPVFRAENSNTSRHLTEFTGLDFETTLHRDQHELMDIEERFIGRALKYLSLFQRERELLGFDIPSETKIPRITWQEANQLVEKHGTNSPDQTHDKAVGQAAKLEFGSRFLFVYGYPEYEKPFYVMPSPQPEFTESFDFLIDGLEVSSGGERINDLALLEERMKAKGLTPEQYPGYLSAFKYGMPKHGGAGLGLERVTQCLLGLHNVRESTLFVRDPKRLDP